MGSWVPAKPPPSSARRASRPARPPRGPHHERPERRAGRHDNAGHARVSRGGDHRRVLLLSLRLAGRRNLPPRAMRWRRRCSSPSRSAAAPTCARRSAIRCSGCTAMLRGRAAGRARRPGPRAARAGREIGRSVFGKWITSIASSSKRPRSSSSTRCDVVEPARRGARLRATREFPHARIFEVSARTGAGPRHVVRGDRAHGRG